MNRKKWFLLLLLLTFFNVVNFAQTKDKTFKVVIDAGHGGEDPGCLGKKSKEKNVNLAVALKLGALISSNYDNVQVIYTRKSDVTVEVYKRAVIANTNHADLFISIHCNAATDRSAHGIETFVMGVGKSDANQEVAKKENAAILREKNFENNYEGFNPNSPEANIIFSLYSSAYLKNSIILADKVQKNLIRNTQLRDRMVQQAGFWVLYKVAMPSILIELGFLSNSVEEEYLTREMSQDLMATSIYNAFVSYKNAVEGSNKQGIDITKLHKEQNVVANENETEKLTIKEKDSVVKNDSEKTEFSKLLKDPDVDSNSIDIRFRIQFLATPDQFKVTDTRFKNFPNVRKYREKNLWKYTAGNETDFESAQGVLRIVKKTHPDAFIIAFKNEEKIPVQAAREFLKK